MRIPHQTLVETFHDILRREGMNPHPARLCATLFADATIDGVPSHGVNRFPPFVASIRGGQVHPNAAPTLVAAFGALERYHGNFGPGPTNAHFAMARACTLAKSTGIACVALSHTNHWMRAGNYGWQAADAGCTAICFTNGTPVMAPHGAHVAKLGNNPLVIAVPRADGRHIVLDTAMSQYSWGRLKILRAAGKQADLPAGFTRDGQLTTDPAAVLESGATLPIGHWKGAGLALLFDLVAATLANGLASVDVAKNPFDTGISQLFLAIHGSALGTDPEPLLERILADLHATPPTHPGEKITYPGERTRHTRTQNRRDGAPVDENIWRQVLALRNPPHP
jgi:3-dehydro-L-gulonate 2-dehydrogenase